MTPNKEWAVAKGVVAFGEVLLRLAAPGAELMLQTPQLNVSVGGAEANVSVSLARLGHDVRMASTLPDNALGRAAAAELRRHGVDIGAIAFTPGRMGLYFYTPGAGPRAADVLYDRAESAFARADFAAIDWERALDGADWLHLSGVTAALGQTAADGAVRAVREAKRLGRAVSFDCNYRARLWSVWRGDAPGVLGEILAHADVVFGDHRDIALILGARFDDEETRGRRAAHAAFAAFPNMKRFANTQRLQHSVNHHELSAALYSSDDVWTAPPISLTHIVDRVGAGDAFAAGILHGLRRGMADSETVRFALAAAALKHVTPGDFNLATIADVEAVLDAGLDVRR